MVLVATMLTIFSPVVTLITYALQAELRGTKSIDVNVAFTSLAIIGMVTSPANRVLAMVAHLASAIASYDRIQRYLTFQDREYKREIFSKRANGLNGHGYEDVPVSTVSSDGSDNEDIAISINNATIRPAPTADPVLLKHHHNHEEGISHHLLRGSRHRQNYSCQSSTRGSTTRYWFHQDCLWNNCILFANSLVNQRNNQGHNSRSLDAESGGG